MNIIVTGASRGVGYEIVKKFASDAKNNILALSRNRAGLEKLQQECIQLNPGSRVIPFAADLTNAGDLLQLQSMLQENFKTINILINNAGALVNKPFMEITDRDVDYIYDVNVKGVFRMIRLVVPFMRSDAHIVNVSSMGGVQGSAKFPGLSAYSSSKGALAILTECLAEEFKEDGIKVNCLALGAVQTEMLGEAFPGYKAPLSPEEMAAYIVGFSVGGHHYFNGKILPVSLSTP